MKNVALIEIAFGLRETPFFRNELRRSQTEFAFLKAGGNQHRLGRDRLQQTEPTRIEPGSPGRQLRSAAGWVHHSATISKTCVSATRN